MSTKRRVLWSIVTVVVLAGVGTGLWFAHYRTQILGEVGGYQVHNADVDQLTKSAKGYNVSRKDLVELLMDVNLYGRAASDLKVPVSDDDITAAIKVDTNQNDTVNNGYVRLTHERMLLRQNVSDALADRIKGKYIIVHYDENFPNPNVGPQDGQTQAAQDADKAYATNLANTLSTPLHSGAITFDQAMATELADTKIGEVGAPAMLQSQAFDTGDTTGADDGSDVVTQPAIAAALKTLAVGAISQPLTGTIPLPIKGKDGVTPIPGYYVILTVTDRIAAGSGYNSLADLMKVYKQKYNYKVML